MKRFLLLLVGLLGLAAAWRFTALREWAQPDRLLGYADAVRAQPLAILIVPALFVGLGLLMFPIVVLRLLTVLTFGPVLGPIYAVLGSVISAAVGHGIGRLIGAKAFAEHTGVRFTRIRDRLVKSGVVGVLAMRVVPLGPFTMVNAAAGAAGVRLHHLIAGTVIAMLPGLVLVTIFGAQIEWLLR